MGKWYLKKSSGAITGPWDKKQITEEIKKGNFNEKDEMSLSDKGPWTSLGGDLEFYEIFLSRLSSNTEIESSLSASIEEDKSSLKKQNKKTEKISEELTRLWRNIDKTVLNPIIDLKKQKNKKVFSKKEKKAKSSFGLVLAVFSTLMAGGSFLLLKTTSSINKPEKIGSVHLKRAEIKQDQTVEDHFEQASMKVFKQTFLKAQLKYYLLAQDQWIRVIEKTGSFRAWNLLCFNYLELWPYTKKTKKDLKVLKKVGNQSAFHYPVGEVNSLCKIVYFLLTEQYQKSASTLDSVFLAYDKKDFSFGLFHYLRALQYTYVPKNYPEALKHLSKAKSLMGFWFKIDMLKAHIFQKMKKYDEALGLYSGIVKQLKDKNALAQIAIIQNKYKKNKDKKILLKALHAKGVLENNLLGEIYLLLSTVESNKELAKKYIKKSYQVYPTERAKNILTELDMKAEIKQQNLEVESLLEKAEEQKNLKRCDLAYSLYKKAFILSKKPSVALKIAECVWSPHTSDQAIYWLNQAIKVDKTYTPAFTLLSKYYVIKYDFDSAFHILGKLKKNNSNSFELYKAYAFLEFKRKNYPLAIRYAKKVLGLFDSDLDAYSILIDSLIQQKAYKKAHSLAKRLYETYGNMPKTQILLAKTSFYAERPDIAFELLHQTIGPIQDSKTEENIKKLKMYYKALGDLYLLSQLFEEAKQSYEKLAGIDSESDSVFLELGKIYVKLDMASNAKKAFLKAISINPDNYEVFLEQAKLTEKRILELTNEYRRTGSKANIDQVSQLILEAFDLFMKVADTNPEYPLIFARIAQLFLTKGVFLAFHRDYETALGSFNQAKANALTEIKKNPFSSEAYRIVAKAHFEIGRLKDALRDKQEAKKDFLSCVKNYRKVIQIGDTNPQNHIDMIPCYLKLGSYDVAQTILNFVSKKWGEYPTPYYYMGELAFEKGNYKEALTSYKKYIRRAPAGLFLKESSIRIKQIENMKVSE